MKFDELDARLHIFETAHDQWVLLGINIVARLDGRGFTRLTRDIHHFETQFDVRFRDEMVGKIEHVMEVR
jgi:tRNA(His) 5'-end guanylyltransferase